MRSHSTTYSNTPRFEHGNNTSPGVFTTTTRQAELQHTRPSDNSGSQDPNGEGVNLRNGIDAGDPLTAKGRAKKRQREKEFDPDDPDRYRYRAYHIRRAFDLFGHIPTIVNEGIKRHAKEAAGDEDASSIQNDRDYLTFNLIVNHLDGLREDITRLKRNPKAFRALVRKIREAADQARNNDTANLKKDIACMLTPDGVSVLPAIVKGKKASSKHDRGFDNDIMGRYLCPISLDWDNAIVRDEIRQGKHAIVACDWPRLLYADCDCNLDDLEIGLGRNMALVRVVKYLFTGRSAAFSETAGGKTTRSGNAALAGMKEVTPRVVAYAACMLRYAISNKESWSNMDKEFNLQEFYWHIVGIFDDSDDFGRDLLEWWNMQETSHFTLTYSDLTTRKVFGTTSETAKDTTASSVPEALSVLRRQREAKKAAKGILGNVTNQQGTQHERAFSPESEDGQQIPNQLTPPSPFLPQRSWLPEASTFDSNMLHHNPSYARHTGREARSPSTSTFYVRPDETHPSGYNSNLFPHPTMYQSQEQTAPPNIQHERGLHRSPIGAEGNPGSRILLPPWYCDSASSAKTSAVEMTAIASTSGNIASV